MATSPWIKMRTNLNDDPAVIAIAARMDWDEDMVVGKLHRMWSWFDQHTTNGHAARVTSNWLDRHLRAPGFAAALATEKWLVIDDTGLTIPEFCRHNGESAKARGLASIRKSKSREKSDESHADSVTDVTREGVTSVTPATAKKRDQIRVREDKRREEKTKNTPPPPTNSSTPHASEPPSDPQSETSSAPTVPETSQDDSQAHWGLVGDRLRGYGLARVTDAISEAKARSFTPDQILEWIDWLEDTQHPKRKTTIGPGLILDRIKSPDAPFWKTDFGWPPVEETSVAPNVPGAAYPYAHEVPGKPLTEDDSKRFARLNADFGLALDSMNDLEVMALIGPTRGEVNVEFRRSDPRSRLQLLWSLSKKTPKAEAQKQELSHA